MTSEPESHEPLVVMAGSYAPSLVNFRGALIAALLEAGNRVLAVAPDMTPAVRHELQAMGARVASVPMARRGLNPAGDLATVAAFVRLFRRERPRLVMAYTVKPVVYGGLAARLAGVPHFAPIVTGLGYAFSGEAGLARKLARGLYRSALAGASHVFFQNEDDLAEFRARRLLLQSAPATVTAGSGVDIHRFAFVPPRAPAPPLRFLMIARLLGEKGVREFVEAAAALQRRGAAAECRLVGPDDPGPDAIDPETVARWRREGPVEILPAVSDVRPLLAWADVFVLPSYREGRPRAAMEALAVGRPLVLADVPGCRQTVVPGQTGRLVPVRNAGAVADAMEDFIRHPERAGHWGRAARHDAEARFAVERVNEVILEALAGCGAIGAPNARPGGGR